MERVRVVGIGGSFAEHSNSLAAVRAALEGARATGAEVELLDVRELALPMYDSRIETPAAARRLVDSCAQANAFVWSSPLYQGTVSGALKNALDWLELLAKRDPPYLTGKVVGLTSTAAGGHALQAINTMEFVARALRAWTVPFVVPINRAHQVFEKDGSVKDAKIGEQLAFLGREVVVAAQLLARVPVPPPSAGAMSR
jgi:FMN reductase